MKLQRCFDWLLALSISCQKDKLLKLDLMAGNLSNPVELLSDAVYKCTCTNLSRLQKSCASPLPTLGLKSRIYDSNVPLLLWLPPPVRLSVHHPPFPCFPCRYHQRSLQVGVGGGRLTTTQMSEGSASWRGTGRRRRAVGRSASCGSAPWRRRQRSCAPKTSRCR